MTYHPGDSRRSADGDGRAPSAPQARGTGGRARGSAAAMPYLHFREWVSSQGPDGIVEFHDFFRGVAQARYVLRRIVRIVDEQAKKEGLDPLEHQLLLQLYGSDRMVLSVNRLAERLDVPAATVSRMLKSLEAEGLTERHKSSADRRVTDVYITEAGQRRCQEVWEHVKLHVDYFQQQLDEQEKYLALAIFGFYVGVAIDVDSLSLRVDEPPTGGGPDA